jgi:hypothetical protein
MPHIWLARRQKSYGYDSPFVHPHSSSMFPLANLHITTLGHGYSSNVHVDHSRTCHFPPLNLNPRSNILHTSVMNLSHVITEFSFGKHFPEITQPLDNSFEVTHDSMSFIHSLGAACDNLQILLRINITFESSQPLTSHHALNLCIQTSTV